MRSVNPKEGAGRAVLDGGATHVLRPAKSKEEFEKAIPIKVELTAGVTAPAGGGNWHFDTQTVVPLGKVVCLGYKVKWEGESFELWNQSGERIGVLLESGCPTVGLKVANSLITELESFEEDLMRRVSALRAGNPANISPNVWKWLKVGNSVRGSLQARQLLIRSWWRKRLDSSSRTVVCIDKSADSNQDLLPDQLSGGV